MIVAIVLIVSGLLHCAAAITPMQESIMELYRGLKMITKDLLSLFEKYIMEDNDLTIALKAEEIFVVWFGAFFQDTDKWILRLMTTENKEKNLAKAALSLYHNDTKALERFLQDVMRFFDQATLLHEEHLWLTHNKAKVPAVQMMRKLGKPALAAVSEHTLELATNSNSDWRKEFRKQADTFIKEKHSSPNFVRDLVQAMAVKFPKRKWLAIKYKNPDNTSTGCLNKEDPEDYISQRLPSGRYLLLLQIPKERDFNAAVYWPVIRRFKSSRGICPASAAETFKLLRLKCEYVKPGSFVGVFKTLSDAPTVYVEASHPSSFKQIWKKVGGPKCGILYSLIMFG